MTLPLYEWWLFHACFGAPPDMAINVFFRFHKVKNLGVHS